ncbi:MAG: thiamine-phosphate kinase [Spirochaetes bacterium]|nr:thiamine-phosphate kinase [Spirochaetota bacterium]
MRIKSEWELLNSIKDLITKKGLPSPSCLIESIGDDCAVFQLTKNKSGLITTDISIESVHFKRKFSGFEDIGFKAMMGNISDISAMGGKPNFAFISIGIPDDMTGKDVLSVYDGLLEAANTAGARISGGDTSKSQKLVINIALYGETLKNNLIRRKGAQTGDTVYVTGTLGDSKAGLEILRSGNIQNIRHFPGLIQKHKRPTARFAAVPGIIKKFKPTSMIDISDGLLSDLRHICESSKAGFILNESRIPVSNEIRQYSSVQKKSYYEFAETSGEEYELLFTSGRSSDTPVIINKDISVTPIGKITNNGFFVIRNKKKIKIPITGFDHFKKKV